MMVWCTLCGVNPATAIYMVALVDMRVGWLSAGYMNQYEVRPVRITVTQAE